MAVKTDIMHIGHRHGKDHPRRVPIGQTRALILIQSALLYRRRNANDRGSQ